MTADQDWCPDWALDRLWTWCSEHDIPLHLFCTNDSPLVARLLAIEEGFTVGWHPNFQPSSSHGATIVEVLEHLRRIYPGCTTVRSHGYHESTAAWTALRDVGVQADSQGATAFQGGLQPMLHWTGIVRLPVYFEDDVFLELDSGELEVEPVEATLASEGLKIFDIHPIHFALNSRSMIEYELRKGEVYGSLQQPIAPADGNGSATVLASLVSRVERAGGYFIPFPELVADAIHRMREAPREITSSLWGE